MSRHLYAVPARGPDEEPGARERSNPAPTQRPACGFSDGPADGGELAGEGPGPTSTANANAPAHAPVIDDDDEAGGGEQLADTPRGLMERLGLDVVSMPTDLGQYCDVRQLGVYKPYVIAAGRHGGAFLFRALRLLVLGGGLILVHVLQVLLRGAGLLLGLCCRWLTGNVGTWPKGPLPRFAIAAAVVYIVVRWSAASPAVAWWLAAPVLLVVGLAGLGHLPAPSPATGATTKSKSKTGKKTEATKPKAKTETETETAESATASLMDRLKALRKSAGDSPAEVAEAAHEDDAEEEWEDSEEDWDDTEEEEVPETACDEVPETPDEDPSEASPDTSREALIEALHALALGGRGVLLTALRDHLDLPDTKHVKAALEEAGIRWRRGVHTTIGNGPGVHREDVPPLPSSQGYPPGSGVCAGQQPMPTPMPTPTGPEEGLRAARMHFDGYTIAPDDGSRFFSV